MRKKDATFFLALASLLLYSVISYLATGNVLLPHLGPVGLKPSEIRPAADGRYSYDDILVARVVDGDTLVLKNKERVRIIGIDTPELHESNKLYRDARKSGRDVEVIKSLGEKSYLFTKRLVEGQRVRLEFDVEKRDRYGRLLAYVFLKDGTMVNAKIIEEGYAQIYTFPPNVKYTDYFKRLQREARENNRGLWQDEK